MPSGHLAQRAGILTLPESLRLMPRPKRPNLVLVFKAIREARTENTLRPESGGTPAAGIRNEDGVKKREQIVEHFSRFISSETLAGRVAIITDDHAQTYCHGE